MAHPIDGSETAVADPREKERTPAAADWPSRPRYLPVVPAAARWPVGLGLLAFASVLAGINLTDFAPVAVLLGAWMASTAVTDKYVHKYPYRYYSYLFASATKAAALMGLVVLAGALALSEPWGRELAYAWAAFSVLDVLPGFPRRRAPQLMFDPAVLTSRQVSGQADEDDLGDASSGRVPDAPPFEQVADRLTPEMADAVRRVVPGIDDGTPTIILDDRTSRGEPGRSRAQVMIQTFPVNDTGRIIRYWVGHVDELAFQGHFVCVYLPLQAVRERIHRRFGALGKMAFLTNFLVHRVGPKTPIVNRFYFALTRGRGRNLSRAEVWGRLSYCGLTVVEEEDFGPYRIVCAQRRGSPIRGRKPSFYPVVGLRKVGLDGQMLTTHKVRSMYPFSEFLQKQIFEQNGLANTGKFKDDFRLTEYGPTLRRYWLDELPQIYDWLRGDIKLVGIRATSPHFLSLYPEEFIRRYIRVKPGLIPPLFDEDTDGFEDIVAVEMDYLRDYGTAPNWTDLRYLWDTIHAIVLRGVRSK